MTQGREGRDPDPVDAGSRMAERGSSGRRHLRRRRGVHPPPRRRARAERDPRELPQASRDPEAAAKGLPQPGRVPPGAERAGFTVEAMLAGAAESTLLKRLPTLDEVATWRPSWRRTKPAR